MSFQVRVLYDFSGEPNTSELSIIAGEILTVTRLDVGEGWWEGLNNIGKSGLFPESYVEKIDNIPPPPACALPPPPVETEFEPNQNQRYSTVDSDSDWDNDTPSQHGNENIYSNIEDRRQHNDDNISEANFDSKGTVTKKSLNRFSSFVKNGGESYILGEIKTTIPTPQKIQITRVDETTYDWPPLKHPYYVNIASPKKETKLKGLKSYTAYQLTPSFNNIKVSRRYKHFDWLHGRLAEKYSIIAVPPLPLKQISGLYEGQFIEHRRLQLQEFINYVCKHPILSSSDVWQHFLTTTDEKHWKQGKRQAERDNLLGANFCLMINAPDKELMPSIVEPKMDASLTFIQNLDVAIKTLMGTTSDQAKKNQSLYKKEFVRIGESFKKLGFTLSSEDKTTTSHLSITILNIGDAYNDIANYYDEQAKLDWEPLYNKLYLYKGITSAFPEIMALHKGAQQKKKDCEKNMVASELIDIRRRSDILTYSIFAELNHFKQQKDRDFQEAMEGFLKEQIEFYKKIVNRLETSLRKLQEN
ncbi:sorting nexin lst-4 [Onthophagus taurus]|uniref:sorting nexin lst-4 n=1 Tax=Onthophagus taurus TaxID=166361 RepID=UPI000C20CC0A|nr:sorting nexin lst-4 [Onthophagus taurus]